MVERRNSENEEKYIEAEQKLIKEIPICPNCKKEDWLTIPSEECLECKHCGIKICFPVFNPEMERSISFYEDVVDIEAEYMKKYILWLLEEIEGNSSVFRIEKSLGTIKLADGRIVQLQLVIETDKNNFICE